LDIICVDVGVYYPPAGERVSHFRLIMDNLRLSRTHAMLVLRRLLPWPHRKLVKKKKEDLMVLLHPVRVFRQLMSEHATPGGLAAAGAVGVFLGAVPLLFVHSLVILYVATRLHLNKAVALNTQHICVPPVVPVLCIEVGFYVRTGEFLTVLSFDTVFVQFKDRLIEWLIGSLIVGPVLALVVGAAIYLLAVFLRSGARGTVK
jgi:uncharacterized protein (DUF2062 family)